MKITFTDQNNNTSISVSDDTLASDGEIMIENSSDGNESWYIFKSLKNFDEFIESMDMMRKRLANHLDG